MAAQAPVYFTDENTLELGKLLRRAGGVGVVYPGHGDLPEVPVGTPDLDWMPVIARRRLIVVTRDRRIRSRPAELRAYWEQVIRSVWFGAKQGLGRREQVELFLRHEERLQREVTERGRGPWALAMIPTGIRPLTLREPGAGPGGGDRVGSTSHRNVIRNDGQTSPGPPIDSRVSEEQSPC